jgi:hypothetical protein
MPQGKRPVKDAGAMFAAIEVRTKSLRDETDDCRSDDHPLPAELV